MELRRSADFGETWSEPERPFTTNVDGRRGSLKTIYVTKLRGGRLLAAGLWVDRSTLPEVPFFNPKTEGVLPLAIVLSESADRGRCWSRWRFVSSPDQPELLAVTDPVLQLEDGTLLMTAEASKSYYDLSPWRQRVVSLCSTDQGATWTAPATRFHDPDGRIFYWDQRSALNTGGEIVAFTWMYDHETGQNRNITRAISSDRGLTWSQPDDLGFADQPSHPAILADDRLVLAWVDRYHSKSIRAAMAPASDRPFMRESEVVLYEAIGNAAGRAKNTGEYLESITEWTYGLPYAVALSDGTVLVAYYCGGDGCIDCCWARLSLD